jgi:hypothetical protein
MRIAILLPSLALACGPSSPGSVTPINNVPDAGVPTTDAGPPTVPDAAVQPVSELATPLPAPAPLLSVLTLFGRAEIEPQMVPEGEPFAADFKEGQRFEQPITFQPGKCYSLVATGALGIAELDAELIVQLLPAAPPVPASRDLKAGPQAVAGGQANGGCWKFPGPLALQGKAIVKATKGQGIALAQVYVR